MHWLDAVMKSKNKVAVREDDDGRKIRRTIDGALISAQYHPDKWREALPEEVEGFSDWYPEEI